MRIAQALEREELSVGEVASIIQVPQSTASRHLKVLGEAGLIVSRAAGPATLYKLVLDDLSIEARALWLAVRAQAGDLSNEDQTRLAAVLAERRLDSQAFFGRHAGEWDQVRARLFGAGFTVQSLLRLLPRRWTVADLGCGTGNVAELLAPCVAQVVAVDTSEAMLSAAKKRLAAYDNVTFVEGTLDKLPLKPGAVDAAVCMLVMHHLEEPAAAIKEMRRVLRPEGAALVVDMVEHSRSEFRTTMGHRHLGFSQDGMMRMFREAGFRDVDVKLLPADAEARGPGLLAATGRV
jgi:SAM-dependent methyltransferase